MIFRQLFEPDTSTYTYLIGCESTRQAALIDPVAGDLGRYVTLLQELDLRLAYTLETHVHADHITGSGQLREKLGSRSIVHRDGGAECADLLVADGNRIALGELQLEVRHTPGHTAGCVSYLMNDRVFTGDALLIGGCGRTDFQQGDAGTLYDSIHDKLFTLPPDTLIYPGHDYRGRTVSTIAEELRNNPRLGAGKTRDEFIAIMAALKLDPPRYIHVAIPANQACGMDVPTTARPATTL